MSEENQGVPDIAARIAKALPVEFVISHAAGGAPAAPEQVAEFIRRAIAQDYRAIENEAWERLYHHPDFTSVGHHRTTQAVRTVLRAAGIKDRPV